MLQTKEVTLLLVEDDDVAAMSVERSFDKQCIANTIIRAKDGREALDLLLANKVPEPYIILLDLNMPRMNGIEFLVAVRESEKLRKAVVFVLTTSNTDKDIVSAYEQYIAGYFVKNETGKGFQKVVELLNGYWKIVHLSTG